MTASNEKTKKEHRPFRLQEQVEWIAVALVLALTVRCFVVEAYQIPTGSMAPTLYGKNVEVTCPACGVKFVVGMPENGYASFLCPSCGRESGPSTATMTSHFGDRILVAKGLYIFSDPRRWDVFVFKSPRKDQQNMNLVKRIVGLPGERIELRDGQVFVNDIMIRKPDRIQKVLWQEVSNWRAARAPEDWSVSGAWDVVPEGLLLKEASPAWQTVKYGKRIADFYAYDGRPGDNLVGDLRVSGHLRMDNAQGAFTAAVWADSRTVKATFTPEDAKLKVELAINETTVGRRDLPLTGSPDFDFVLFTVDGHSGVDVAGEETLRYEESIRAEETPLFTSANGVFFQGQGTRMLLSNAAIKRDVYYRATVGLNLPDSTAAGPYAKTLGPAEYLGLGDNSPLSFDSRAWGGVPAENILGKAFFLFFPLTRIGPVM